MYFVQISVNLGHKSIAETYSEPYQTSKTENFFENSQAVNYFCKTIHLRCLAVSECAFAKGRLVFALRVNFSSKSANETPD